MSMTMYESRYVNVTDLFDKIHVQYNMAMEYTRDPPRRVYIGRDDFATMLNVPQFKNVLNFTIPASKGRYYSGNVFGVDIYVIPWIMGILVVPQRKKDESRIQK